MKEILGVDRRQVRKGEGWGGGITGVEKNISGEEVLHLIRGGAGFTRGSGAWIEVRKFNSVGFKKDGDRKK